MKLGSDEHERFLAAAGGLAVRHATAIVCVVFETSMARTERILAGDEVPEDHMVQAVAELTGVTTRTLLTGVESGPESIEEAQTLGRAEALRQVLKLLEESERWYAGKGRAPERAEALRACYPLLVVQRLGSNPGRASAARRSKTKRAAG